MKRGNKKTHKLNQTDRYFKEKFQQAEANPGSDVWQNIESELDAHDARRYAIYRRRIYRTSVALLLLLLTFQTSNYLYNYNQYTYKTSVSDSADNLHQSSNYFLEQFAAFRQSELLKESFTSTHPSAHTFSKGGQNHHELFHTDSEGISSEQGSSSSNDYTPLSSIAGSNMSESDASALSESLRSGSGIARQLNYESEFSTQNLFEADQSLNPEDYLAMLYGLVDNPLYPVQQQVEEKRKKARFLKPQPYQEGFHFGFEVHGMHNWFEAIDLPKTVESDMEYEIEGGSGSRYGAFVGYDFNESMGVEAGFFMSSHHFTLHGEQRGWEYTRNFRLDYIELPVMFRYKFTGYSYRLNQTHGVTFKLGGTYNLSQGGQFEETKNIFNENEVFKKHHAGIIGGIQYDLFIATNLLLSVSARYDMVKPLENAYYYQSNLSGGASLRYFIPVQKSR